jgi:uncharacterized protein
MPITALYAGLLALLFFILSVRVIALRQGAKVSLGDGGNAALLRRVRAHANFAEYAPFAVLLMGSAETLRAPSLWLHAIGAVLLIGRLLHAYGVSANLKTFTPRVTGMVLTFVALLSLAGTCLWLALPRALFAS